MSETLPPQSQSDQPGSEAEMDPRPQSSMTHYRAAGKLAGKTALISGGDSGIGRAVAIGFAKEGADVAITWLDEREDAAETVRLIEAEGRRALSIPGDIGNPDGIASISWSTMPPNSICARISPPSPTSRWSALSASTSWASSG
jgi:hypothetical protein